MKRQWRPLLISGVVLLFCVFLVGAVAVYLSNWRAHEPPVSHARGIQSEIVAVSYWSYECPRNVPGHDVDEFDIAYEAIQYDQSIAFVASHMKRESIKAMCSCGAGVAQYWENEWQTQ